jgi:anti-sigma factor RsiW
MHGFMSSDYACSRARELISRRLDGDLSELDETRLASHLDSCATCRGFAWRAQATALALRTSPLEQPSRPIMLPQRRKTSLRAAQVSAVAAVLLVATAVGTFALPRSHARRPSLDLTVRPVRGSEQKELQILRNVRLEQIKPRPVGLAGGVQ